MLSITQIKKLQLYLVPAYLLSTFCLPFLYLFSTPGVDIRYRNATLKVRQFTIIIEQIL